MENISVRGRLRIYLLREEAGLRMHDCVAGHFELINMIANSEFTLPSLITNSDLPVTIPTDKTGTEQIVLNLRNTYLAIGNADTIIDYVINAQQSTVDFTETTNINTSTISGNFVTSTLIKSTGVSSTVVLNNSAQINL